MSFFYLEVIEILVTKVTELESINLLKYDELYQKIGKKNLKAKINDLNSGMALNKFTIF